MLSSDEIDAYHQDGYVIPKGFCFNRSELEKLQAGLDAVLFKNPTIMPDRLMNTHLNKAKPYRVEGHPVFHWLAHDPRVLSIAESVMGPNLILLFTHLFCKPASSNRSVPWHQDGPFWPVTPMKSCTIWVALDDVDEGNGAMKIIPGSHKKNALEHNLIEDKNSTLNRELPIENVDEQNAELIELKAGQVSVHDIGIIHGSAANASGRRRAGLALRYMPSTSCMNRIMPNASASWEDMPMELVRGINLHEGNDFSLGDFGNGW
jgi:ectoine hydroxylase-related dioxygenase (phytanoyl-CoA dioxygenase family)